jgi:hypothetical protein
VRERKGRKEGSKKKKKKKKNEVKRENGRACSNKVTSRGKGAEEERHVCICITSFFAVFCHKLGPLAYIAITSDVFLLLLFSRRTQQLQGTLTMT